MRIAMVVTGGLHPSGRQQVVPSLLALFSRLARDHEVHAFAVRHLRHASTYDVARVHGSRSRTALRSVWLDTLGAGARASQGDERQRSVRSGPWLLGRSRRAARGQGRTTFRHPEHRQLRQRRVRFHSSDRVRIAAHGQGTRDHSRSLFAGEPGSRLHAIHGAAGAWPRLRGNGDSAGHGTRDSGLANPVEKRPGVFRLLQVASLSRVKNQQLAIDAVALLSQRVDVHLDLVGEDTLGGQLQESARELDLADRVTFHGFLPQDELPRLFASADLYVQTSLHEAAGVSVLEAAACGVPVIGTRAGYIADWTPDRAVAIDDPSAETFARAIEELLADADRRRTWPRLRRRGQPSTTPIGPRQSSNGCISLPRRSTKCEGGSDRPRERQVERAHATPARRVALDVEIAAEGDG